jgi:hypothetical protein
LLQLHFRLTNALKWITNYQQISDHSHLKANLSEKILKLMYGIVIDSLALHASLTSQQTDMVSRATNWRETFSLAFKDLRAHFGQHTSSAANTSSNPSSNVSIKIVDVTISNKENHQSN